MKIGFIQNQEKMKVKYKINILHKFMMKESKLILKLLRLVQIE